MIPIYPKKCKKSNKSKKKVVDLGCTRRFHFFKMLKSTKKEPLLISYFLLEAPWDAYPSISRSLKKFQQATYTFADAYIVCHMNVKRTSVGTCNVWYMLSKWWWLFGGPLGMSTMAWWGWELMQSSKLVQSLKSCDHVDFDMPKFKHATYHHI